MVDRVPWGMHPGSLRAWKTYLACSLVFAAVFLAVYPVCNWLADRHGPTRALFLPFELRIPFVPVFLWVYASLFLLWPIQPIVLSPDAIRRLTGRLVAATLLAGICFLLFPAHLGFARSLPEDPFLAAGYRLLFGLDRIHNLVPSLHVLNGALVLLAFMDHTERRWLRVVWGLWLGLIAASTLLVHQHHLLDVVTGLGFALLLHRSVLAERSEPVSGPALGQAE